MNRYKDEAYNEIILESHVLNRDLTIESAKAEAVRLSLLSLALEAEINDALYAYAPGGPRTPEEEYEYAVRHKLDRWVAACGGTERPSKDRMGRETIYVFNPHTGYHAYLNVETDMIMPSGYRPDAGGGV